MNPKHLLSLFAVILALAGCANQGRQQDLQDTLRNYESVIRWSEWDGAANFLAPEYLAENPITALDMDRLRLFRVTQYRVRASTPVDEGNGLLQTVEIRAFNRAQAVERVFMDRQEWRWDEELGRWWLHSGLPDVTQGR